MYIQSSSLQTREKTVYTQSSSLQTSEKLCTFSHKRLLGTRQTGRLHRRRQVACFLYLSCNAQQHLCNNAYNDTCNNNNNNRIRRRNSRFLQSPYCAVNCLQYVRSRGPGAIVCKSRATHRALITCYMCATWYEGTAQLLSLTELKSHLFLRFILLAETINR